MVDTADDVVDPTLRVSEEGERARALAAVLRDQAERVEQAREADERRRRRKRVRRVAAVVLWIAAAWIWLLPPSWTRVQAPEPPPLAEEAAALRLRVYLQIQAIEAYRHEHGHLPDVLPAAGPPFPGVAYERRDSHAYTLSGRSPRVLIRYRSEEPPSTFGRGAVGVIAAPGPEGSSP